MELGVIKFFGCRVNALSCRVEIALKMKGVDYEYVEDPNLGMPVLLHNGKRIAECGVILEYIEENWKLVNPLLPQDLYERASARFTAKFIDTMVCMYVYMFIASLYTYIYFQSLMQTVCMQIGFFATIFYRWMYLLMSWQRKIVAKEWFILETDSMHIYFVLLWLLLDFNIILRSAKSVGILYFSYWRACIQLNKIMEEIDTYFVWESIPK